MIEILRAEGIPVSPGYTIPVYKQPVFVSGAFGARGKQVTTMPEFGSVFLPETEKACNDEAIWLTQNVLLGTESDMQDIVDSFAKIKENIEEISGKETK